MRIVKESNNVELAKESTSSRIDFMRLSNEDRCCYLHNNFDGTFEIWLMKSYENYDGSKAWKKTRTYYNLSEAEAMCKFFIKTEQYGYDTLNETVIERIF